MSIKRIVDTAFWEDSKVIDKYSVEDKYFLLYLMTNPHTTQAGIYKLPKRLISFETGYTVESVSVILERFETKYKNITYNSDTQEIAVLNSLKYSIVKGGKPVSDLLIKELSKVEDDGLIVAVYRNLSLFWERSIRPFDETIKELFEAELEKRNVLIKFNENDNENDNDNEESYPDSCNDSYRDSSNVIPIVSNKKSKTKPKTKELQERFGKLWELYPKGKKQGKTQAFKSYEKAIKDGVTDEVIEKGINDYKKQIEIQKTELRFIKQGSTWFNQHCWEDEYNFDGYSNNPSRLEYSRDDEEIGW